MAQVISIKIRTEEKCKELQRLKSDLQELQRLPDTAGQIGIAIAAIEKAEYELDELVAQRQSIEC